MRHPYNDNMATQRAVDSLGCSAASLMFIATLTLTAGVSCGGPELPATPAVAVTVMKVSKNPILVSPTAATASTLYGGCRWITRRGDAVVCFDAKGPTRSVTSQPPVHAVMRVFPISGGRARTWPLFAGATSAPPAKHAGFRAAQTWLNGHRIKPVKAINRSSFSVAADRTRIYAGFEGRRWTALLSPPPQRPRTEDKSSAAPTSDTAPSAKPAVSVTNPKASADLACQPVLKAFVVLPDGTPAAVVSHRCGSFAVPARLYRMTPASSAAERAAAAKARAARAAQQAIDVTLSQSASKPDDRAPERFTVEFETTKGKFQVQLTRAWAPHGVDRFYTLVKRGFFRDVAFFRVVPGFMAQFGIHGTPAVAQAWSGANIPDDPVNPAVASNQRGYLTFAKAGPNTRSSQLFISFRNNANLDRMGFPPIGRVVGSGMTVVDTIYNGYGEGAPRGRGPNQMKVQSDGNRYLKRAFPLLDYIRSVRLVK